MNSNIYSTIIMSCIVGLVRSLSLHLLSKGDWCVYVYCLVLSIIIVCMFYKMNLSKLIWHLIVFLVLSFITMIIWGWVLQSFGMKMLSDGAFAIAVLSILEGETFLLSLFAALGVIILIKFFNRRSGV